MTVGVVRETAPGGERRVALVPKVAASLVGKGVPVVVESGGAGLGALIPDEAYTEAGGHDRRSVFGGCGAARVAAVGR